jgi:hypothetical protein
MPDLSPAARAVANIDVDAVEITPWTAESLGYVLAEYFDSHPMKPRDAKPDDDLCGFSQWAVDQANRMCERIAQEARRADDA